MYLIVAVFKLLSRVISLKCKILFNGRLWQAVKCSSSKEQRPLVWIAADVMRGFNSLLDYLWLKNRTVNNIVLHKIPDTYNI